MVEVQKKRGTSMLLGTRNGEKWPKQSLGEGGGYRESQ